MKKADLKKYEDIVDNFKTESKDYSLSANLRVAVFALIVTYSIPGLEGLYAFFACVLSFLLGSSWRRMYTLSRLSRFHAEEMEETLKAVKDIIDE